jgi:DNA-binding NarL/FixJ family response regulator
MEGRVVARVLIGEFGAIVRRGLKDVLAEGGCEVVAEDTTDQVLLQRLIDAFPDVVVVDLDRVDPDLVVHQVCAVFPAMKVVAFSAADESTMRVFPAFHGGESYSSSLSATRLLEAIKTS